MDVAQPGGSMGTRDPMSCNARVVIIDDSTLCRTVIRELLEHRGYDIAGEAGSVATAIDLVERLSPDAVLLDIHLPDGNGFEVAAYLRAHHPNVAVLLTSIDFQSSFYALADVSGARGFVPKSQLGDVQFELFWSNRAQA